MKVIFSVVSLLIVMAVVGVLAKKQLSAVSAIPDAAPLPGMAAPAGGANMTPQMQSQQMQQQVRQAVESSLQQPRPMPDEK